MNFLLTTRTCSLSPTDLRRRDKQPSAITSEVLKHFRKTYQGKMIIDDDLSYYIYGILYSEDYRTKYVNNLMKKLLRIPRVATYKDFMLFSEVGHKLAFLHLNFGNSKVKKYQDEQIIDSMPWGAMHDDSVRQMGWGTIKREPGNAAKDKTILHYNDRITNKNILLEAQKYVVNTKSAPDWVVERASVKIDKDSGIINNFNDYGNSIGNPRYPLELFFRIITVSLKTMKIVHALLKLVIRPLDQETPKDAEQ